MNIRLASDQDYSIILELLKDLYIELGEEADSIEFLSEDLLKDILHNGQTQVLLAFKDEKSIGILTLTETQAIYAGGNYGIIDEMFVINEFRNTNIGKQLIDEACKIGKQKAWKRIAVTAPEANNERAVNFYEQNAFEFAGPKLKRKIVL